MDDIVGDGQKLLAEFVDRECSSPTYTFNELRDQLCGDAKFSFDVKNIYLYGIWCTCNESKREWITRTIELEGIDFVRHPKNIEELLSLDANTNGFFNFQRAMNIDAINKETKCVDRKAHLFWEIPVIDEKVNELMQSLSFSGSAKYGLSMPGETKDAKKILCKKEI